MKVTIRYDYDPKFPDNPYWVIANDRIYASSGESFEHAKQKLLMQLGKVAAKESGKPDVIPPSEEVEI